MKEYAVTHRRKKRWLTVVTCLAAAVVFCTTYALILPAITLEKEQVSDYSYEVHQHDVSCYDAEGNVICGYADYAVHTHDENCYDEDGSLVCELEEIEEHVRDTSRYEEQGQSAGIAALPDAAEIPSAVAAYDEAETPGQKEMMMLTEKDSLYLSALAISNIQTGMTPFDNTDEPGNDSGADNSIIRTFDTITYNLDATVNDSADQKHTSVVIHLEITLEKDMTEAMFNTDLFKYLDDYTITYYDENGGVLAVGTNGLPSYSANEHANGSAVENPYRTPVRKQILTGFLTASNVDGEEFASLTKTLQAGIDVKASCNGDVIQPRFRCWVEGEDADRGGKSVQSDEITVSAAANYNVTVRRNTHLAKESVFDLQSGTLATDTTADNNKVSGLLLGYTVELQLYNQETEKGLKGIELPKGEISVAVQFEESATSTSKDINFEKGFTPILWDYRTDGNSTKDADYGVWGRRIRWETTSSSRANWASAGNDLSKGGNSYGTCYSGGSWSMSEDNKVTDASTLSGTVSGLYTLTVSGYDFDLDNFIFPWRTEGTTTTVYPDNVGCFSVGYMEVLLQYDDAQISSVSNSTSIYMAVTASDFNATSMSSGTAGNVTNEMITADNKKKDAITVKNPGTIDKINTIASNRVSTEISRNYLGIAGSYWAGECGDPTAFAGSTVYLAGEFYLSAIASTVITDYNYLQIFDSAGFTIASGDGQGVTWAHQGTTQEAGEITYLYAADPEYPGGYDTNKAADYEVDGLLVAGCMGSDGKMSTNSRMNTVQEDDLLYFDSVDALERAGYTCIGVMMEARGAEMNPYSWTGCSFPVTITDEADYIGKTICTVNRVRAWINNDAANLTWKGATTEKLAEKVAEKAVYKNPKYLLDTQKVTNSMSNPGKYMYVKTEYDDGNIVTGTHLNGKYGGMSVLILGYEAGLKLDAVETAEDGTTKSKTYYDLDKNERTADYVISNIETRIDSANSNITAAGEILTTELTITLSLDENLAIDLGTLKIGETNIRVKGDKDNEAEVTYTYTDHEGKSQTITYTVCYEYKEDSGNYLLHISDVPVGVLLPDITFRANIGKVGSVNDVKHQQQLTAVAQISGQSDRRAYSEAAGNESRVTIEVNKLASTSLVKAVNKDYAELDDTLSYTLSYTNNGSAAMKSPLYLYDIMPYSEDTRGSSYTDSSSNGQIGITSISANATGAESGVEARLYYSMVKGSILKDIIEFRKMPVGDNSGLYLRQLLGNALVDAEGNLYFFQNANGTNVDLYTYDEGGSITARNFTLDDNGHITEISADYDSFVKVNDVDFSDNKLVYTTESAKFISGTYLKLFRYLGDLTSGGSITADNNSSRTKDEFTHATCIFAVARNLAASETINIHVAVATEGNRAGDYYVNSAHSWIGGTAGEAELDSNTVATRIVAREISGVVWYDANLNGVRDSGEETLSGVTADLFQWNETENKYVRCTTDVTGDEIGTLTTGDDGAYKFSRLAAGDYIVAFSGDALEKYSGAADYQVKGANDSDTNDGVALSELTVSGISGYSYAIRYSPDTAGMMLHDLDTIGSYCSTATYIEAHANQDLGLIIAGYELPDTGGTGTTLFTIGGLLLIAGAVGYGYGLRRRRERRAK